MAVSRVTITGWGGCDMTVSRVTITGWGGWKVM